MSGASKKKSGTEGIARHATVYAIGNVVRQLAGFLMLPVYTRYLSPADYGAVGLLALALALLEPFFGARLTQAIPKFYFLEKSERARQSVVVTALTLTGAVSAVTATFIWLFSGPTSELLFGTREYALATALFGLNMLMQPIEYTGMTFIRMQERSVLFLVISLSKLVVQIGLNLLLVIHLELGVVGVILSGVIASGVFGIGLTAYTLYYNRPRIDFGIGWRMLVFSWPLWFAGLAGLYTGSSSRFFLRIFGSLDAVVRDDDLVDDVVFLQRTERELLVAWIVFDQQQHWRPYPIVNRTVVPFSGSDSSQILPPCRWIIRCVTARPMPVPGKVPTPCSRWNGVNSLCA